MCVCVCVCVCRCARVCACVLSVALSVGTSFPPSGVVAFPPYVVTVQALDYLAPSYSMNLYEALHVAPPRPTPGTDLDRIRYL